MPKLKQTPAIRAASPNKRLIINTLTDKGWVANIPVTDDPHGPHCQIYSKTWQKLVELGVYPILDIDRDGFVVTFCYRSKQGRYRRVARLIANANDQQRVSLVDGNELNLLDENIYMKPLPPPYHDREDLSSEDKAMFATVVEYKTNFDTDPTPFNNDFRWGPMQALFREQKKAGMI